MHSLVPNLIQSLQIFTELNKELAVAGIQNTSALSPVFSKEFFNFDYRCSSRTHTLSWSCRSEQIDEREIVDPEDMSLAEDIAIRGATALQEKEIFLTGVFVLLEHFVPMEGVRRLFEMSFVAEGKLATWILATPKEDVVALLRQISAQDNLIQWLISADAVCLEHRRSLELIVTIGRSIKTST